MCGWDIVGAVILGGGFLFEEVRLRSHVRRRGEGSFDPVRTQEAQSLFLLNEQRDFSVASGGPAQSLFSLPITQELSECGRLSPGLPDATE